MNQRTEDDLITLLDTYGYSYSPVEWNGEQNNWRAMANKKGEGEEIDYDITIDLGFVVDVLQMDETTLKALIEEEIEEAEAWEEQH